MMGNFGFKTTIYDILGYMVPGCVALVIGYVIASCNPLTITMTQLIKQIQAMNIYQFISILIAAYILGHLISGFSAIIIENLILNRLKPFSRRLHLRSIMSTTLYAKLIEKFKIEFNCPPEDKDIKAIACSVEENHETGYATALIFLSFYGMGRNLSFVFFMAFLFEIIRFIFITHTYPSFLLAYLLGCISAFIVYFRFKKHYLSHIVHTYLVTKQ